MSQRQPLAIAEVGVLAAAAFAIVGRSLSPHSSPHNVALAVMLVVALVACALWRRGEALTRPGGAVFLAAVAAWLIWLGARARLDPGALGIPGWPPAVVALVGWATVVAWLVTRAIHGRGPTESGAEGAAGRGFWVGGAWAATAVIVLLAVAVFVGMRRAGAAPSAVDLVELLNWALLYAALFTAAMRLFVGARARRDAVVLAAILVLTLLPIEVPL